MIVMTLRNLLLATLAVTFAVAAGDVLGAGQDFPVSPATLPVLTPSTPIPGSNHVASDIDGDGLSDLMWVNPYTNQVAYWLMATDATGAVTRKGQRVFNITPGYFLGAIGDFGGVGRADLVFTSAQHDLYLWTNDANGGFTSQRIMDYPAGWELVGAGDVDGDGKDDLLWMNPSECKFAYWLMDHAQRTGSRIINVTCGYYPLSIGYYTPTNRLSIILTSAAKELLIWDSSGTDFQATSLATLGDSTSTLIALGGGFEGRDISYILFTGEVLYQSINRNLPGQAPPTSNPGDGGEGSDGGYTGMSSAGFLVQAQGVNKTGLISAYGGSAFSPQPYLEVCPPLGSKPYTSGPDPLTGDCPHFDYPAGWFVAGAFANGNVPAARMGN
jgi:hypothetical protein